MLVLVTLFISSTLFSLFIDNNNGLEKYGNINYTNTGYFNNNKVVDSLIRGKDLSDLINTNEFQKVENELEKIKSIKNVDVYLNSYLELEIDIIDRLPIAFLRESNSYLDFSGVIIEKNDSVYDSLPQIKGLLREGEVYKVLKVI